VVWMFICRPISSMIEDLRYSIRHMRKQPGFTAVIVLTMAICLGANTAIFSIVDAVLWRPLPYPAASRLVSISLDDYSGAAFTVFRTNSTSFAQLAAIRDQELTLTGVTPPELLRAEFVSPEFFRMLGIKPIVGRTFAPEGNASPDGRGVVISYGLWQRHFGRETSVLGRWITLGDQAYAVVGVLPPSFVDLNTSLTRAAPAQVWIPIMAYTDSLYRIIGRLKPGVTVEWARQETEALNRSLRPAGAAVRVNPLRLVSIQERLIAGVRPRLHLLLGAVVLVLLLGCANIAGLLMAQGSVRRSELAMRVALGAPRWRIVRLLLTESVLLSALGGAVGVLLAVFGLGTLVSMVPTDLPLAERIRIDLRVLALTGVLSLLTGLLFGVAPALRHSRLSVGASLRSMVEAAATRTRNRFGEALVGVETAATLVLLVSAVLMIRSFWLATNVDWGFRPAKVIATDVVAPKEYRDNRRRLLEFYREGLSRLQSLPGIEQASIGARPLGGERGAAAITINLMGETIVERGGAPVFVNAVSPGYFDVLGIRLLRGRLLTQQDLADPRAAVINESTARAYFDNRNPIGARIREVFTRDAQWMDVVGIVGNVKRDLATDLTFGIRARVFPEIYVPYTARVGSKVLPYSSFILRSGLPSKQVSTMLRSELKAIDSAVVERRTTTLQQAISEAGAKPRFYATILSLFAFVAVGIAAVGIYGLFYYYVSGRTHEFGIRLALGAGYGTILGMILKRGAKISGCGIVIGLLGAWASTRLLRSWLFMVEPTDTLSFAIACSLLAFVATVACYVPARRAASIEPLQALRHE
jgi:predicted permease